MEGSIQHLEAGVPGRRWVNPQSRGSLGWEGRGAGKGEHRPGHPVWGRTPSRHHSSGQRAESLNSGGSTTLPQSHHFRPEAGVLGWAAASSLAPSHPCPSTPCPGAEGGASYSKSNPATSAHGLLCQLPHWNPLPPWLWQRTLTGWCQHVPPALPRFPPLHQPQVSLARLSFLQLPCQHQNGLQSIPLANSYVVFNTRSKCSEYGRSSSRLCPHSLPGR